MSIRNVELQTTARYCSSDASTLNIGGQVPAGMKRWVTFISLDAASITDTLAVRVHLASVGVSVPTMASLVATGNRKMLLNLRASKMAGISRGGVPLQIPDKPDMDKPLFSIDEGKWLGVFASNLSANLFVQYFDE